MLNSHPNVSSNGEIFSVRDRRENISTILGTLDKLYSMDWLTSAAKNECTAAFGLKWMLNQVNYHCIPHFTVGCVKVYLAAFEVHIVRLAQKWHRNTG